MPNKSLNAESDFFFYKTVLMFKIRFLMFQKNFFPLLLSSCEDPWSFFNLYLETVENTLNCSLLKEFITRQDIFLEVSKFNHAP